MQKFAKFAKIRDVCEKRAKTFFCKYVQKIYQKAFSNNELGHISITINLFPCLLSKYVTFFAKFAKFAKIRDVCEKRAKTFFLASICKNI